MNNGLLLARKVTNVGCGTRLTTRPIPSLPMSLVFGKRKDIVFKQLKTLLDPFGIARYYTDDWGAYERHLDADKHEVGKRNTQKIERKNLNLRTWIKRLARKTICFSKDELMHDTVIGLLINKVEFGIDIHAKIQV